MPDKNKDKQTKSEHVECNICMKEVPRSEAQVDEASDYVAHFCGLDCFDKWKNQKEEGEK